MLGRGIGLALAVVLVAAAVALPAAAKREGISHLAILSGGEEVPARDTGARGVAQFRLSGDGNSIEYRLIVANINNPFMAHIHLGVEGVNGPIVVWLFPSTDPVPGPPGAGRMDGIIASGVIMASNLVGPLQGHPLADLLTALNDGGAYVNVHTNDGLDGVNTGPGDFPGGEIRGQVRPVGS